MPRQPDRVAPQDQGVGIDLRRYDIDVATLPPLIPVPRAAEILGLSRASAYRYAAAGDLPVQRFGGRVYVVTAKGTAATGDTWRTFRSQLLWLGVSLASIATGLALHHDYPTLLFWAATVALICAAPLVQVATTRLTSSRQLPWPGRLPPQEDAPTRSAVLALESGHPYPRGAAAGVVAYLRGRP